MGMGESMPSRAGLWSINEEIIHVSSPRKLAYREHTHAQEKGKRDRHAQRVRERERERERERGRQGERV
jgi:hypothetical protein